MGEAWKKRGSEGEIKGNLLWLRPNGRNDRGMKRLLDMVRKSNADDIMFMLHASELMPGESPAFRTDESLEN